MRASILPPSPASRSRPPVREPSPPSMRTRRLGMTVVISRRRLRHALFQSGRAADRQRRRQRQRGRCDRRGRRDRPSGIRRGAASALLCRLLRQHAGRSDGISQLNKCRPKGRHLHITGLRLIFPCRWPGWNFGSVPAIRRRMLLRCIKKHQRAGEKAKQQLREWTARRGSCRRRPSRRRTWS